MNHAIKPLSDVISEVRQALKDELNLTDELLEGFRRRIKNNGHKAPQGLHYVPISDVRLNYAVQRQVILKHIYDIIRQFDPRLISPAATCRATDSTIPVYAYDGQHRMIVLGILGYTKVPVLITETDELTFASYAFEMIHQSTRRLTPGDLHKNAITRYGLGADANDNSAHNARKLQDQFDVNGIDLEDKNTRNNSKTRGPNLHYFSHFKYAYKGLDAAADGTVVYDILNAIKTVYPGNTEIDQGVYIGLLEIDRLAQVNNFNLPKDWMVAVLSSVRRTFGSSHTVHSKAKKQFTYINPGATWSAPNAMSNFVREVYMLQDDNEFALPFHGKGSLLDVEKNPAKGLFTTLAVA